MDTACGGTHLIQQTPEGPNVTLEVISVFMDSLRTHVVRCANKGVSGCGLGAEEPTQAKITQLHHALCCDEDVGWLDVCQKEGHLIHCFITLRGEIRKILPWCSMKIIETT